MVWGDPGPGPGLAVARIAADLSACCTRFAIVGSHAVSARTEPRFTRGLDLAVAVADDREAEVLVGALSMRGYRVVALIEQEATGRLATVRFEHASAPGVAIDLLFATAGVEPEVVAAATTLDVLTGLRLPVATVGHLLALKTLSMDDRRRPQDRTDLASSSATDAMRRAGHAREIPRGARSRWKPTRGASALPG